MRLTLRTLLAYLDDRLPPGKAKEIGQKVTTSPFATELAERIRNVVRRRRLAKEEVGQKSIDANLIAEYLDDQLTPELVALIERQILSSDATLAEVAAAHQIIGTLKDPVDLSSTLKDRLYKLGPQPDEADVETEAAAGDSSWKPLEAQTVRQKRSPMLLLGVMTLGWLGLVATDSDLFQKATSPESETAVVGDPIDEVAKADLNDAGLPNADNTATSETPPAEPEVVVTEPESTVSEPMTAAASPSDSVESNIVAEASPVDSNPEMAATTPVTPVETTDAAAGVPETSTPPETVASEPVSFDFIDSYAMAVRLADNDTNWTWVANDIVGDKWTNMLSNSVFGIPAPFDAQLSAPELGWLATMHGSTLFRTTADGSAVEIIDGEMVLQQLDIGKPPSTFTVRCDGDSFQVAVPPLGRQIGITVHPLPVDLAQEPASIESNIFLPVDQPCLITVYAADTPAHVTIGDQQISVNVGMQLRWRSGTESTPTPETSVIPDWVFEIKKPKTDSTNELLSATATAFRTSKVVAVAADSLMESRNPLIAEYSVNLPGLTKQLDVLCRSLLETKESVVRKAAIAQLHYIQLTSPGAKDHINELLRTRLPEMETENAMKMLAGVSSVAAEDRIVSAWLVEMLDSSRPALRELAIYNLQKLTGSTENFLADDEPSRRSNSVKRWAKILSRNGGRILPASE